MKKEIETIKKTRNYLLGLINELSIEQLNEIPEGFNNNIIWNTAHLIAAQQGVCYKRAGMETFVKEEFFQAFKPGSKPEKFIDKDEVVSIKELFISSLEQLEKDYQNNLFKNYTSWTSRYGVELTSIAEALYFLTFHEGMHTGSIMALKKVIKKNYQES